MNRRIFLFFFLVLGFTNVSAQSNPYGDYFQELNTLGQGFYSDFYQNYEPIYSAEPKIFLNNIQGYKKPFQQLIIKYQDNLDPNFVKLQEIDNNLFFDRFILDYPSMHLRYKNKLRHLPDSVNQRLQSHIQKFNDPELIELQGYNDYIKAFVHHRSNELMEQGVFSKSDNKKLDSVFYLLPKYFSNPKIYNYWAHFYLKNHIENNGVKNIKYIVDSYFSTSTDAALKSEIKNLYDKDVEGREGHKIVAYKKVKESELDLHLFLPDKKEFDGLRPVILYFHGGSWTEGKPDWFFNDCKLKSKEGWVAVAVEYRIADRHHTLPFEAVKDAKSAVRWIREHAEEYGIDTNKIVVSGNSAGGHLALSTVLSEQRAEPSENLEISSEPNLILINSGVYDLTIGHEWIKAELTNKDSAIKDSIKHISPYHNVKKTDIPVLMIHGTNDNNVPSWTANEFYKKFGGLNKNLVYKELPGAGHFIWLDQKYSEKVNEIRNTYLKEFLDK